MLLIKEGETLGILLEGLPEGELEGDSVMLLAIGLAEGEVKDKALGSKDGTVVVVGLLVLGMAKPISQHKF